MSHPPEIKAQVMAALMAGQSIAQVSKEYNLPEGTVKSWKSRAKDLPPDDPATPKKEAVGELILQYLEANLKALKAQAELFSDRTWLANQDASSVAVLHGVMTDKAIRLLEAMAAAQAKE